MCASYGQSSITLFSTPNKSALSTTMKIFVLLTIFMCSALCNPWSLPQLVEDTPEVAAAKSDHLAAHAKAKHSASSWKGQSWDTHHNHDDGSWKDDTMEDWHHRFTVSHDVNHDKKWTGPVALPPGYDKHGAPLPVKDTSEVAAAKSKHLAALAKTKHSASFWEDEEKSWDTHHNDGSSKDDGSTEGWHHHFTVTHDVSHDKKWSGPVALSPGYDKHGAPLPVEYTSEVAAAKSKHLAAHAKAKHSASSWKGQSWDTHHNHNDGSWKDDTIEDWHHRFTVSHDVNHDKKWTGPVALPPGYDKHGAPLPVKDTSEVAAAKSKHLAEHAKVKHSTYSWEGQRQSWDNHHNHDDGSWKDDTTESRHDNSDVHDLSHEERWY